MTNNPPDPSNTTVTCLSIYGQWVRVPIEKMRFRASVYALIKHEDNILLVQTRTTHAYTFPGGGIDLGEKMADALKREVREETGIDIKIGEMFHVQEEFFYFDPEDIGYHAFLFFFNCKPITTDLQNGVIPEDFRTHQPSWVPLDKIDPEAFLPGARAALSFFLDQCE